MMIVTNSFRRLGLPLLLSFKGSSSAFATLHQSSRSFIRTVAIRGGQSDYEELPLDFPRRDDVLVALDAVRQACRITQELQPSGKESKIVTVEKLDCSPVTIADYAVQALVLHLLHHRFPEDGFIAEEDTAALREDDSLLQKVFSATGLARTEDALAGIDLGKYYTKWNGEPGSRPHRVWTLDPIDGTKGFLRGKKTGGQYAIALALLEGGEPVIGVLGCPNLPTSVDDENYAWKPDETDAGNSQSRGCIFVATRDGGCYQVPLHHTKAVPARKLTVTPNDGSDRKVGDGRFCIGVEKFSDALGQTTGMAQILHGKDSALDGNGEIIRARRIDSQAKHGVIARGGAEWYVRLPKPGYVEWIWDHAAGNVVIEEAGGKMTDTAGRPLDFSLGPKLSPTVRGILMSNGYKFHDALVDAFAQEEALRMERSTSGN